MITVTVPPADLLTLAEAKRQCRVDGNDDNDLLSDYISAVTGMLDGPQSMTGRCLGDQTLTYQLNDLPADHLIPIPGATSVDGITYYDADNVEQTLAVATYYRTVEVDAGLFLEEVTSAPATYDRADAVTITVSAGNGVPDRIKQAALMIVARWYDDRDAPVPAAAQALVDMEKAGWVAA